MKQRVRIILLNWNGFEDTIRCLRSIQKVQHPDVELATLVIDNASTDNSVSKLKQAFPEISLIVLPINKGFTGGNNEGMKRAVQEKDDYIWILNNDTEVSSDSLLPLITSAEKADVGIVGSMIYFMAGREYHHDRYKKEERGKVIWYAGGKVDWSNMYVSHRGVDEVDSGQYAREEETPFITGCSLFMKRKTIETIGYFNEEYFSYSEDFDYCMRVRQKGLKLLFQPKSHLWHKNAGSTGKPGNDYQMYYMTRNRLKVGLLYAPVRTKFALAKEAMFMARFGNAIQKRAIIDAALGRWGKQYEWE